MNKHSLFPNSGSVKDGLSYWRERILFSILAASLALSIIALVPALRMAFREELWLLAAANAGALLISAGLLVFRRIHLAIRASIVLIICYCIGVIVLLQAGIVSGWVAWLFCFAVLSGVLLGLRAALGATLLNAATLAAVVWLAYQGAFGEEYLAVPLLRILVACANFIFLNAVAAVSVTALVNGLQTLNRSSEQATAALTAERAQLLEAKQSLKGEIEERKKSEKQLAHSERKYRQLAESIPDVIWTTDMDFRFTYVSPAAIQLQGWSPEEFQNLRVQDVLPPESYEKAVAEFTTQLELAEKTGDFSRPSTLEVEMLHKGGSTVWTEVTASFLLGEDNRPIGVLGVTRDIRERRRVQKEKEELLASLERSKKMEALGTLAGGVAHDLNNVLSGVVSYPDLLLMDIASDNPLRRRIEIIRESGKKAAAIVQDLLTLARRGVAVSEMVNLNELVNEYLLSPEFNRLISFHPNVDIDSSLAPDVMNVMGSPIHLSKTIMNLVSNAAEAMPTGGRVTIGTRNLYLESPLRGHTEIRKGAYVVLEVLDSGIGIAPEDVQRIFEPFYTKKKMGRSGTGLGMAVVWGTVQDHLGYIDVQSRQGEGTAITIYLPSCGLSAARKPEAHSPGEWRGAGETILVVDDAKEQREIVVEILEQLGYAATALPSGEEALVFLEREKVDLLILDMIMDPGIDGLETFRRVIERHPGQKAIIASGFAETDRVKSAQRLGAGEYIKKPYTVDTLARAIKFELKRKPDPA